MSSSNSPCAACKLQRRKCTQECVLAPYFPPDQPQKFANVHKVFGASNVTKILNDMPISDRQAAVDSLAYEAESRLRDPIYGCVGLISLLQQRLKKVHCDIYNAKQELSSYIGPSAMLPTMGVGGLQYYQAQQQQQQQRQMIEAQQLADVLAAGQQHQLATMMRNDNNNSNNYEDQQHQLLQHDFGVAGFNINNPAVIGMGVGFEDNQFPFIQQEQEQHDDVHNKQ